MLDQIRAIQTSLSKAENKVALTILEHPQKYLNGTLNELAMAAKVSEPTIVRFCRRLKLDGFREFNLRLAQELASQLHYQHREIKTGDNASLLVDKVIDSAIVKLSKLRNQLNDTTIDQAIDLLSSCSRIEIYGIGGAGIVVQDAQLKFARLGLNSQPYSDTYLQRVAASMLKENCCVLAISNSGRSKDLIHNIELAKSSGAKIISITATASPLAALSDLHLSIDLNDDDYLAPIKARFAHMAVVDILAIGLALRCKPEYLQRLRQANQLLEDKFLSSKRKN